MTIVLDLSSVNYKIMHKLDSCIGASVSKGVPQNGTFELGVKFKS